MTHPEKRPALAANEDRPEDSTPGDSATNSTVGKSWWIAMHCGEEIDSLQESYPSAFLLLCQIARRARWKDCQITGLRRGEAFIGDWKRAGLHSRKAYEVAKKRLEKCGLARFEGRNKGTVATLVDSRIFSITDDRRGKQKEEQRSIKGESKEHQGGTIHTDTKITQKTQNTNSGPDPLAVLAEKIVGFYPKKHLVSKAMEVVLEHLKAGANPEEMEAGVKAIAEVIRTKVPSKHLNQYVPGALSFFENKRWKDDPETFARCFNAKDGSVMKDWAASLGRRNPALNQGGRQPAEYVRLADRREIDTGGRKPSFGLFDKIQSESNQDDKPEEPFPDSENPNI